MTKKQKKVLIRIIVSAVLLAGIMITTKLVEINKWIQLVLYLVPYLIIGYDILKKAVKGMLPDNSLGRKQLTRLRIFKDGEHTHEAQKPEVKEF